MFAEQLIDRRYVSVYMRGEDNPLAHNDMLVFSFLGYKDRYGQVGLPQNKVIAERTGLDRATVGNSIARLQSHGLIVQDQVVLPDMWKGYFRSGSYVGKHWTDSLSYWKCYVRDSRADNPLTVSCCSVISYLWHSIDQQFAPRSGWSVAYLAKCLSLARETVSRCLGVLEEHRFLRLEDWAIKKTLRESHLSCFSVKSAFVSEQNTLKVVDFDEDDEDEAVTTEVAPEARKGTILLDPSGRPLVDVMIDKVIHWDRATNRDEAEKLLSRYCRHSRSRKLDWHIEWEEKLINYIVEHEKGS